MKFINPAWLLILAAGAAAGQTPIVFNVVNDASGLPQGLPGSGIAQGSLFLILGTNLGPSTGVVASNFQNTTLANSSVSVTVGSTTVNALMYYSSYYQITALLPSATPTGSGTVTVTYNGNASATFSITVATSGFGIYTLAENGQGNAIVTQSDYSIVSSIPGTGALGGGGPYTYSGAANVGDTLIIWGTGIGPVSGSDQSGVGLGVNMPSIGASVLVGGIPATVTYQGRSGCCIGEDQINFVVPAGTPTGCAVPLAVQIGGTLSNVAMLPVASGSRSCSPVNPVLQNPAVISALTNNTGPINYASFQLGRTIGASSSAGVSYEDYGFGAMAQISMSYGGLTNTTPVVLTSIDSPPFGTCSTSNSVATGSPALFTVVTGLDAGKVTLTGPSPDFPVVMKEQPGTGTSTQYSAVFSTTGVYFSGGNYTLTAAGGANIGAFNFPFSITPPVPTWSSSDQARLLGKVITRSSGVTINWTGGSAGWYVIIHGASATDATGTVNASFSCLVPSTLGTFTVPAYILESLPQGPYGELDFEPTLPAATLNAPSLNLGILTFHYQTSIFPGWN